MKTGELYGGWTGGLGGNGSVRVVAGLLAIVEIVAVNGTGFLKQNSRSLEEGGYTLFPCLSNFNLKICRVRPSSKSKSKLELWFGSMLSACCG